MYIIQFLKYLKHTVENKMPDRYFYWKSVYHLFPKYIKAVWKNHSINLPSIKFYTDKETVDLIIQNRMSLSRFGDGELAWMACEKLSSFQQYSEDLANDLRKTFLSKNKNLLVGIPIGCFDSSKCNIYAKMWWKIIRTTSIQNISQYLSTDYTYANTNITRPYIDYSNRNDSKIAFENLKRIWQDRDICIVEGEQSRLGMGNDLFNNAQNIKRIICPSTNAYEKKDIIIKSVHKFISKDTLILAALGPTATILADILSKDGYQFIDIGHVDIEYMWYLNHSILRDAIPGKYVNESSQKFINDIYKEDPFYVESIIHTIS